MLKSISLTSTHFSLRLSLDRSYLNRVHFRTQLACPGVLINYKFMTPNKKQLRQLKSMCHALKPVIRVGQKGITEALVAELEIALSHHELIKIKVGMGDREERKQAISTLAKDHEAFVVQQIGQIAVLFRRNHEKPVIIFPK